MRDRVRRGCVGEEGFDADADAEAEEPKDGVLDLISFYSPSNGCARMSSDRSVDIVAVRDRPKCV